jgi:hypothetical protein
MRERRRLKAHSEIIIIEMFCFKYSPGLCAAVKHEKEKKAQQATEKEAKSFSCLLLSRRSKLFKTEKLLLCCCFSPPENSLKA